ncbi:hypothetical protein NQ317_007055 [Molorchus minor]|uniref:VPS9 domain-containing protein n=1 Tax=Molorchus minor TaxID=1323400 RepID=A0ABQ9K5Y9_9CUCU|nr:hypothetical protein NQ317_007055 [Molorchus minor]
MDIFRVTLEKLNCLCYTYDLIFAEIKISPSITHSQKELEIPVINNEDVIPVLATIMAKSNLLYFPSNLFYINFCGESLMEENYNNRTILAVFEIAFKKIMETEEDSIKPDKHKKFPHLDVCETIKIMSSSEAVRQIYSCSEKLREEERGRLVSLLSTSTSEKDFIPMNLPKMFN